MDSHLIVTKIDLIVFCIRYDVQWLKAFYNAFFLWFCICVCVCICIHISMLLIIFSLQVRISNQDELVLISKQHSKKGL